MTTVKQHTIDLASGTPLADLVALAESGDEVIITRDAAPVARLVATPQAGGRRVPGRWRGRFDLADEFFFAPLPEEELAAWEGALTDAVGITSPKSRGG